MSSVRGMEQQDYSIPVGEFVITARSLAEYRAMFSLTEPDLRGRILDCPGGASSFAAEAGELGAQVIAVDPAYRLSAQELERLALGEIASTGWATAHPERFVWDFYGDIEGHQRLRRVAAAEFLADLRTDTGRYIAAELPALDFEDRTFDLVLSSHLLFTYAESLDFGFHLAALRELLRVSKSEVRVFPLVDYTGAPLNDLVEGLREELAREGVHSTIARVDYEFQRGSTSMLRLSR